eukprot:GHRR01019275.1.p1 GENE.GHRR01019275.1~~GHRR01019275.1.p1  ORF type:complete len:194 (+),score=38.65 GHRR01019275.1:218-799(+)
MLGAPTERIAGIAFFLFTLIQVPYFALDVSRSQDTAHGLVLLSPLQVTAAQVAKTFPSTRPVLEYALLPGGWMRENLTPYIRCMFKTSGKACRSERAKLTDLQHAQRANNLPVLVKLLDSNSTPQQWALVYGSALTVLSAVFAAAGYTVKTAMIGFALLALGVIQVRQCLLPCIAVTHCNAQIMCTCQWQGQW